MENVKWTREESSCYRIVNEVNVLMGYYETKEEALKGAIETDSWRHKGYCYAIALVQRKTTYANGKFHSSIEETVVIDRLVKEDQK